MNGHFFVNMLHICNATAIIISAAMFASWWYFSCENTLSETIGGECVGYIAQHSVIVRYHIAIVFLHNTAVPDPGYTIFLAVLLTE